jgi:lipid II:glycine glycyltransferase (peptidoglycan interpeptide bridge formation enzyme)
MQPPLGAEHVETVLARRGYAPDAPEVAPTGTLLLDLSPPLEIILASMSATKRTDIRQSLRRGVQVKQAVRDDIDVFHELHSITAKRQGFAPLSKAYMYSQWDALHPRGAMQLVLAEHVGRPLAGRWITAYGDTVTDRMNGWNREEAKLQPNLACQWWAIRWAKERGFRFYDFGGIGRQQYVDAIRKGEFQLADLKHTEVAYKAGFNGRLVLLPRAWQRTFSPIARPIVRMGYASLARSAAFRNFVHWFRNG